MDAQAWELRQTGSRAFGLFYGRGQMDLLGHVFDENAEQWTTTYSTCACEYMRPFASETVNPTARISSDRT